MDNLQDITTCSDSTLISLMRDSIALRGYAQYASKSSEILAQVERAWRVYISNTEYNKIDSMIESWNQFSEYASSEAINELKDIYESTAYLVTEFDDDSGPYTLYQIEGLGAVRVYDTGLVTEKGNILGPAVIVKTGIEVREELVHPYIDYMSGDVEIGTSRKYTEDFGEFCGSSTEFNQFSYGT